jgi:hypothetical protein
MKALLAFLFHLVPVAVHDDTLRANQFRDLTKFSPYVAMLPIINGQANASSKY